MFKPFNLRVSKWQVLLWLLRDPAKLKEYAGLARDRIQTTRELAFRLGRKHQKKLFAEAGTIN